MLSLSKKTDYALLALSYLARSQSGRVVNAREIADRYDIPPELLAKVLQKLAKAQMLVSTAGPTGGYLLARPAAEISVGSVVELIDGLPAIARCMRVEQNDCDQLRKCTIRSPLARLNSLLVTMLYNISLAEMDRADERFAGPGHVESDLRAVTN